MKRNKLDLQYGLTDKDDYLDSHRARQGTDQSRFGHAQALAARSDAADLAIRFRGSSGNVSCGALSRDVANLTAVMFVERATALFLTVSTD